MGCFFLFYLFGSVSGYTMPTSIPNGDADDKRWRSLLDAEFSERAPHLGFPQKVASY